MLHEHSTPAEVMQVAEKEIRELMAEMPSFTPETIHEHFGSRWVEKIDMSRVITGFGCGETVQDFGAGQVYYLADARDSEIAARVKFWQNRLDYAYRMQAVAA